MLKITRASPSWIFAEPIFSFTLVGFQKSKRKTARTKSAIAVFKIFMVLAFLGFSMAMASVLIVSILGTTGTCISVPAKFVEMSVTLMTDDCSSREFGCRICPKRSWS